MAWQIIRNGEPDTRQTTCSGICKRYKKPAEVTTFFHGSILHKMDLQKTYRFSGYRCSLTEEIGYTHPACKDDCPLIQKEWI